MAIAYPQLKRFACNSRITRKCGIDILNPAKSKVNECLQNVCHASTLLLFGTGSFGSARHAGGSRCARSAGHSRSCRKFGTARGTYRLGRFSLSATFRAGLFNFYCCWSKTHALFLSFCELVFTMLLFLADNVFNNGYPHQWRTLNIADFLTDKESLALAIAGLSALFSLVFAQESKACEVALLGFSWKEGYPGIT